jgi:hypothetical protein
LWNVLRYLGYTIRPLYVTKHFSEPGMWTRGLGAFPNPIKETPRSKDLYGCFINEVGSYCQHCKVTGH